MLMIFQDAFYVIPTARTELSWMHNQQAGSRQAGSHGWMCSDRNRFGPWLTTWGFPEHGVKSTPQYRRITSNLRLGITSMRCSRPSSRQHPTCFLVRFVGSAVENIRIIYGGGLSNRRGLRVNLPQRSRRLETSLLRPAVAASWSCAVVEWDLSNDDAISNQCSVIEALMPRQHSCDTRPFLRFAAHLGTQAHVLGKNHPIAARMMQGDFKKQAFALLLRLFPPCIITFQSQRVGTVHT
ncbi:uncharacterized protein PAC_13823 [Phialocephala subalpina]|uniref:Uncharacterized protein n=1 Tax=Phialocephala subalpina TaxID=576137 RepID=A0A1L7XG43_9HELO|nr:uncharacterized protein PAC_13823 [Phialocephala subalpina]